MTRVVVGVSGPSGSGKSTLAHAVRERLPSSVIIQQDWYFKDGTDCPATANFCDFQWLDIDQFAADVRALARGSAVAVPSVDFATFERVGTQVIQPQPLIIVEGMTIFRVPALERCFDIRYYIESNFETLAERKRGRDRTERGKPADVIDAQLKWMAEEYEKDAHLRTQADLTLLHSEQPIDRVADAVAAEVGRGLAGPRATPLASSPPVGGSRSSSATEGTCDASD